METGDDGPGVDCLGPAAGMTLPALDGNEEAKEIIDDLLPSTLEDEGDVETFDHGAVVDCLGPTAVMT